MRRTRPNPRPLRIYTCHVIMARNAQVEAPLCLADADCQHWDEPFEYSWTVADETDKHRVPPNFFCLTLCAPLLYQSKIYCCLNLKEKKKRKPPLNSLMSKIMYCTTRCRCESLREPCTYVILAFMLCFSIYQAIDRAIYWSREHQIIIM